jgi:hypothetical protein
MNQVKMYAHQGITAGLIRPKSECHKLHLSNTANKRNFNWPELTLNWTLEQCLISWRNLKSWALGAQPRERPGFGYSATLIRPRPKRAVIAVMLISNIQRGQCWRG